MLTQTRGHKAGSSPSFPIRFAFLLDREKKKSSFPRRLSSNRAYPRCQVLWTVDSVYSIYYKGIRLSESFPPIFRHLFRPIFSRFWFRMCEILRICFFYSEEFHERRQNASVYWYISPIISKLGKLWKKKLSDKNEVFNFIFTLLTGVLERLIHVGFRLQHYVLEAFEDTTCPPGQMANV